MNRILIVEDEAIVAMDIEDRLTALGYQVAGRATSGEQALELVESGRPDLILIDIRLAGKVDGIMTAREIRRRFHLPAIFLTAYSEDETLERAKLAEPFGYLFKPFDDRELKSAIEIALYKHRSEEGIRHLNRLYDVLSRVNQAVVHCRSREELLTAVCRILVDRGEVDLAWIGWHDPVTSRIMPETHFGRSIEILQQANFYANDRPEGQGNPGKAIREGKPFVCNTCVGEDCLYPEMQRPHQFGFQSCGSFPLRFRGQVCGALNISVSEPGFFSDQESKLLEEVATDLSFALDKLDSEVLREQAEAALIASESGFRKLYDSMRDAFAMVDLSGKIIKANTTFKELIGYNDAELSLLTYSDITPDEWHDFEKGILQNQVQPRGYSEIYEKEYRHKDGTIIPVELRTFLIRDDSGQPISMWAIIRDITERKQTEKALQASNEKFRLAMEAAEEGIWDWNLSTGEQYLSPGFMHVVGYNPGEIELNCQVWEEHVHPEDLRVALNSLQEHLTGNTPSFECEYRVRTKQGPYLWALSRGRVVSRAPDGTPRRIVGAVSDITAKKLAQAALEESLSLHKATLESTADGILVVNLEGRIVSWNQKFLAMWHLPVDIVNSRDNNRVKAHVMDQLQDPQGFLTLANELYINPELEADDLLHFKDGRVFERYTRPQYLNNQIVGRVLSFRDVTARLQAEAALKESEAKYRRIVETASEGIWAMDQDYRATYVNQIMAAMLGYLPAEMIGQPVTAFMFPEDLENHQQKIARRCQGLDDNYEQRFRCKDGSEFWSIVSATVLTDTAGSFQGSFAMLTDITERKRMEDALRDNEQFLNDIFTSIKDGLSILDLDRNLIRVNPAMEGFAQSYPMLGRKCYQVYHNRNTPCQICPVTHTLQTGEASQEVVEAKSDDGNTSYHEIFSYPFINRTTGQLAGAIEYVRDVTEQKKAAASLQEMEKQLLQAQKMEAIGTLAGGIAHDFNNILWAMMGFAEMASYNLLNTDMARQYLDQVLKAGQRAKKLVGQILAFSCRSESVKKPLFLKPIVQEAINLLRATLPATIEINAQLLSESPVLADATQINHATMNLATNAFHAMEKTGGLLSITLDEMEFDRPMPTVHGGLPPGSYVRLKIEDTGAGIDPEIQPRIFEPYFTTKEVGKGTGLGLATVLGIVKSHGGEISLESQPGQGTAFSLYFPIIDQQPDLPIHEQPTLPKSAERILFIDDEPALAELGKAALTRLGYAVTASTKSREALEIFQTRPQEFDLVITDLTMPHLNGLDLARHLQALRPELPIIICTGYSELLNPAETRELGIKEILGKPLSLTLLAETVKRVLQSNPS
jgi:PAS domain S-box-containing protein